MTNLKRAIIFVHFDRDNIVDDYVYFYLSALQGHSSLILFITTSTLSSKDEDKLSLYCSKIIIRENVGYDFMSYKTGLNAFDYTQYDEVLICNDSVYGPFYPLDQMFQTMQSKNCDFWGITDNTDMAYHLQSYFLLFRKNLLIHHTFKKFWDDVKILENKEKIIEIYEVGLTRLFQKNGFTPSVYIHFSPTARQKIFIFLKKITLSKIVKKLSSLIKKEYHIKRIGKLNVTLYFWQELILTTKMPFIKIMMLRDNPNNMNISSFKEVLSQVSDYDTGIIRKHLLRMKERK